MNICIPRGRRDSEYRVGLIPAGVKFLTQSGHTCYIEHDAGVGCGYSDYTYQKAGGQIVYNGEEIYGRADVLLSISRPTSEEFRWMRPGQVLLGYLSLAAAPQEDIQILLERKITAIGFEVIQDDNGSLPVLKPASQAAGRMAPHVAAWLAQNNCGGKGILLGGVPGVPPAEVVILGAGTVGTEAARVFLGMGATVYLLDRYLTRLQELDVRFGGRLVTMVSYDFNISKVCQFADVLVGAVLEPGGRAPLMITREMIRSMRPQSIVMDISIDQGGCIETSHPTTHSNPTFVEENVLHYCVPNMTSVLGRTVTHAMSNAFWPYVQRITGVGIDKAISQDTTLARGVYTHQGEIVHSVLQAVVESRRTR